MIAEVEAMQVQMSGWCQCRSWVVNAGSAPVQNQYLSAKERVCHTTKYLATWHTCKYILFYHIIDQPHHTATTTTTITATTISINHYYNNKDVKVIRAKSA